MYACILEIGRGFFGWVCTRSNATANFCDQPPSRNAKEPEPHWQGSGSKWTTHRATVDGPLAWGRGKPPLARCPSTAHKSPTHHVGCCTHAPQSIAGRCAPHRKNLPL